MLIDKNITICRYFPKSEDMLEQAMQQHKTDVLLIKLIMQQHKTDVLLIKLIIQSTYALW